MFENGLVIDPGHGGDDPGATNDDKNKDLSESNFNLNVSKYLYLLFSKFTNIDIVLTRHDNTNKSLYERVKIANVKNYLVLSIHSNGWHNSNVNGVETLCFSEKTKHLNDTSYGFQWAVLIHDEITDDTYEKNLNNYSYKFNKRGVKPIYDYKRGEYIERELYIIRRTINPCVICELGFITNHNDYNIISQPINQFHFALNIFKATMEFFSDLHTKNKIKTLKG